jgi:predicted RecA/RadA family phage recombinase
MRNYVKPGNTLSIPAVDPAASGDVVQIGDLIGIAASDVAIGDTLDLTVVGVFEIPKVGADAIAVGDPVFWDATVKLVTTDDDTGANTKLGVAVTSAPNPSGSVNVRLNGTF